MVVPVLRVLAGKGRLSLTGGSNVLDLVHLERFCSTLNSDHPGQLNGVADMFGEIA